MLKIKNKFIIFVILLLLFVIIIIFVNGYLSKNDDRNSFVYIVHGQAQLNGKILKEKQREKLSLGDTVRTIQKDALAVLEWGDGSVTRLGGNTSLKIEELNISDDLGKLNINFELFNGKTWSNVVSFLGEGSYFKETFRDSEAAVRGTIFDLDLNNDYLYVLDHKVDFTTSSGKLLTVTENSPFDIKNFTFINLDKFINSVKDKAWEAQNIRIDKEMLEGLKNQIYTDLDELVTYKNIDLREALRDEEKKKQLYNELLTDYQKLNFLKPEDGELFKIKLELKDKLLELSDRENKDILISSTLYDFKGMLDEGRYENVDLLLAILSKNKEILDKIDLKDYFKDVVIPEEIKEKILNKFGELKYFFTNTFNTFSTINLSIEDLKNIEEKATQEVHERLDTIYNESNGFLYQITQKLKNLFNLFNK